jgi:hypothetical protein
VVGPGFAILPNEVALLASYICFSFVLPDHFYLSTFDTGEKKNMDKQDSQDDRRFDLLVGELTVKSID